MLNTSITVPIRTSGSDFIAVAIKKGLAKAGDVFVKDSAYYDGSKKEVSFFIVSNPPCDWDGVCEGCKPSVRGFY